MKTFKPNLKMSHGGHYCWGGKVMKKAEGGGVLRGLDSDSKPTRPFPPPRLPRNLTTIAPTIPGQRPNSPILPPTKTPLPRPPRPTTQGGVTITQGGVTIPLALYDPQPKLPRPKPPRPVPTPLYRKSGGKVKAFWETKSPKKTSKPLTSSQKASAKARAAKAGRPYPNLIDNAAASRRAK